MMNILLIAAAALCPQETEKIIPKDGKAPGVYYGWSPVLDLWGNIRRNTWTMRPDGVLFWGAPRESFEKFVKRPLTAEEKKDSAAYEVRGSEFHFHYRDGSKEVGKVLYREDGSVRQIDASALYYNPVRFGVPFELTGYWTSSSSFNNAAYKMSTTSYNNFSFFKGGTFVQESGVGTICTAVQQRTTERQSGDTVFTETIRQEVTKFYGDGAKSKMGTFRVSGSALLLEFDDGKKESRFIGTIPGTTPSKDKSELILLGGTLYTGTPGVFPTPKGEAAAPPPPPPPALCKTPQFELQAPAGWTLRDQEELHFLVPDGVDPNDPFVVILLGTTLGTTVTDPALATQFEEIVKGLAKGSTVKSGGATVKLSIDGAEAVRIPYEVEQEGKSFRVEATCASRDGQALVALTIGSGTAMKKFGDPARSLIQLAKIAGAVAKEKISAAHFELGMPKGWTAKETEQDGTKYTMLVPPGRDLTNEYAAFVVATPAETHKAATEKAAIAELRAMVGQLAAGFEAQGEPETLKADGEPAVLVKYAGKSEAGEVVVAQAYMVVKHGHAVILMLLGKEKVASEHAAALRAGFESLKVKK
jgi:hypothetical protein